jgi:hypothetical protein
MQTINIYSQAYLFELAAFSLLLILEILWRSPWQSWGKSIVLIIIPGSNVALSLSHCTRCINLFISVTHIHAKETREEMHASVERPESTTLPNQIQICAVHFQK